MTKSAWNTIASACFLIGIILGAGPLLQWFLRRHPSGVISALFGVHGEPWVWVIPATILGFALVAMVFFGTRSDRIRSR